MAAAVALAAVLAAALEVTFAVAAAAAANVKMMEGWRLGWEVQFSVPISGTPIASGILILYLIPKILVGFFFSKFRCLESQNIGIPISNIQNSSNFFAQELSTSYRR